MSIDTSLTNLSRPIVVDGISYIPSTALLVGIPKVSFKDDLAFAVVDYRGESQRLYSPSSELGFYYNDTRFIGIWEMTFNGVSPIPLDSERLFGGNTAVFSMTNPDFPPMGAAGRIRRDSLLIRRVMTIWEDTLFESVEIKNFADQAHSLQVEQWVGGRFDDVFEVRGYARPKRGKMLASEELSVDGRRVSILQYEGLDGVTRKTFVYRHFSAEKIRVSPSLVGYFTRVDIPRKESVCLRTVVSFDRPCNCKLGNKFYCDMSMAEKMAFLQSQHGFRPFHPLSIESDNAILNRSLQNAEMDIYTLLTYENSEVIYPYAGIPWFSAPFGRDGMLTAYQLLPWYPKLARGVLDFAFEHLGSNIDSFTDEQPGKVFHEMRRGEMAKTREVPFIPYYGSVDSTPLCLILLHEYIRWTLDAERLKQWWPSAMRALEWLEKWGDADQDGFIEYAKQSPRGLVNQGWKDSHDSIMHADGRLAQAPIRLCEAQGYAFRAKMGLAALAGWLGKKDLAASLRLDALRLRSAFLERFWDSGGKYVYLALDGKMEPCAVRSSNMGHCLWSQILFEEQAREVSNHLLSDAMFSGYGIRTLADTEVAFNPLSYHNGSVWPHDNSIIMEGLRLYGYTKELEKLAMSMMDVLEVSDDFRLPELYCGFRRRGDAPPIPYQVACKPQAWAAGAVFLMMKSLLGLSMDIDQDHVVFNSPLLTPKVNLLEIKGLRCRNFEADIILRRSKGRTHVDVTRKSGNGRVLTVRG